jgi:predicted Mrr-cat superfamily restriction endonuclease
MLKKNFIRDGNRRIIGSVTTGYSFKSLSHEKLKKRRIVRWSAPTLGARNDREIIPGPLVNAD